MREVFGKAFTTSTGQHYLYDVNTGEFIELNEDVSRAPVCGTATDGLETVTFIPSTPEVNDVIEEAFISGLISSRRPDTIQYPISQDDVVSSLGQVLFFL